MLPEHLVSDHLGLDEVRHLLPQLARLQVQVLLPPECEEFLLDLGHDEDILSRHLGAARVNVPDEVENRLYSSLHFLQGFSVRGILKDLTIFHVRLHLQIELLMDMFVSINLSTESSQLLSSERTTDESLLYFLKSFKLLCEVSSLLAATAGESEPLFVVKFVAVETLIL